MICLMEKVLCTRLWIDLNMWVNYIKGNFMEKEKFLLKIMMIIKAILKENFLLIFIKIRAFLKNLLKKIR